MVQKGQSLSHELGITSSRRNMVELTVAILIQAGNSRRGSSEPPDR
jgi:hypothetical protein